METIKTKYRIIPFETHLGDMYLQFEDNGVWRYVPKENHVYVTGKFLTIPECPIEIENGYEWYFLSCYYKNQDYELVPFARLYANIQDYFDRLKIKRDEYLKEKEEKGRNAKIIYLQ